MRAISLCIALGSIFCGLAAAGDTGFPPRPRPSDYPVRQTAQTATIAAALVPPNQAGKMFSPEIAKQYIVVEVAVYPEGGHTVNVKPLEFMLRIGDRISHAEEPRNVSPWPEKQGPLGSQSTDVTTEAGVAYRHATGPNGRSAQSVDTYDGVTVTNGGARQSAPPAPSNSGPDPRIVADKLRDKALPEGPTGRAVAGSILPAVR
jgi:hypothetical protein